MVQDDDGRKNPKPEDLPESERVYVEGQLLFTEPVSVSVKAHTFLTPITPLSAKVIATYQGTPVAAVKKIGKGEVFYIGTNLGASIEEGSKEGLDLVRAIVARSVQRSVSANGVRPRLIESSKGGLLIVFNDQNVDQTEEIRIPDRYSQATDLYGSETWSIQGGTILVKVPFEGVSVIRLK